MTDLRASHEIKEVPFYHPEGNRIVCDLCPHHCKLKEGQKGICRFRERSGNRLIATNYAQVASLAIDPIEKKPLYHFKPGTMILSAGANGCNLQCLFCQNSELSQGIVPSQHLPVEKLLQIAGTHGSIGVAFTYSEPLMWYETVLEAAQALKRAGYVSVLVTNGFIEAEPLSQLLPYVDALNIDLKSLEEEFYKRICKGRLEPVQRTIRQSYDAGVHMELTHLVVTGWNDKEDQIEAVTSWIAGIDDEIPLHLSRYFPHYKYNEPPTSAEFMRRAFQIARQELKFVYLGNIAGGDGSDTYCPSCGALLVRRRGYHTEIVHLKGDICGQCGRRVPFR